MSNSLNTLEQQLSHLNAQAELANWQPELSGDIDIRIAANGDWFHEGTKIERLALIKLFSSILRRETDGEFYLLTPVEKWRIQVEDAPLIVTAIDRINDDNSEQQLQFTLNNEDHGLLGKDFKLRMETKDGSDEPAPYIDLPNGLFAKLSRSVFYHLLDYAETRGNIMGVASQGSWLAIGTID